MSVDAAKEFLGNLKLAEQIKQVKDDKEKVQQLIKEAGYDFTEEELKSAKSELSDEDLDNVAGGYFMMIGGNT
jgi:predicted ribosomally synthesized peptide with nif11-like leader